MSNDTHIDFSEDEKLQPWQVEYEDDNKQSCEQIPKRFHPELLAKANGPLAILFLLSIVWILTLVFAIRYPHILTGRFKIIVFLQYLMWAVIDLSLPIVSLFVFDTWYTRIWSRNGRRKAISMYALEAWMSLIIRPINVLKGKFINVFLVAIPVILVLLRSYSTDVLGRETTFRTESTGKMEEVRIGSAGGGSIGQYIMTGHRFLSNTSGVITRPNNRFVYVLDNDQVLIPSLPDIGTYDPKSRIRAVRATGIHAVIATISRKVLSVRDNIETAETQDTVSQIGKVKVKPKFEGYGRSRIDLEIYLRIRDIYRQFYFTFRYESVTVDLTFATFYNGTQIYSAKNITRVSVELPGRLTGKENPRLKSAIRNFVISQNGGKLIDNASKDSTDIINLGLLLSSAFGIRSAKTQNFLDGMGKKDVEILEERTLFVVPRKYWILAGVISCFIAVICIIMLYIRITLSGGLFQLVSLLSSHIKECPGAGTPPWQRAYTKNKKFAEDFMNRMLVMGYSADPQNPFNKEIRRFIENGEGHEAFHLVFRNEKSITKDSPHKLQRLLCV